MKQHFIAVLALVSLMVTFVSCGQGTQNPTADLKKISGTYTVNSSVSQVSFSSIKNNDFPVTGYFTDLSGKIEIPKGNLSKTNGRISLDLTTLDTGNDGRDENVLTHFFEVESENEDDENYNSATFVIDQIDSPKDSLKVLNKTVSLSASGDMSLHGTTKKEVLELDVVRTGKNVIQVRTRKPYSLSIESFEMQKQLKKLMKVCGHDNVGDGVPIHLSLTLQKTGGQQSN